VEGAHFDESFSTGGGVRKERGVSGGLSSFSIARFQALYPIFMESFAAHANDNFEQ
jgi:hypothetical protein